MDVEEMAKFCSNCGVEVKEDTNFCPNCGAPLYQSPKSTTHNFNRPMIQKRDIALCVILSFLTCGLYGLYWFVTMTDETNSLSDEQSSSGAAALIFTLLTCGLYGIYWNYKMGQKLYVAGKMYGLDIADNSVLYLILSIFGLGIVSECLIQNDLNRFSNSFGACFIPIFRNCPIFSYFFKVPVLFTNGSLLSWMWHNSNVSFFIPISFLSSFPI